MYYTNNGSALTGALSKININGSIYQLGNDASNTDGGILKLFNAFETYKTSQDGAYNAKVVYDEIKALKDTVNGTGDNAVTLDDKIAAAKSTVAQAADDYITVSTSTDQTDGHTIYTIGTSGIDSAISTAVSNVVNGAPAAFDTLKEIADWITTDTTGAAAILADVANKANKVTSATSGNFAGLDSNGDLTDSGYNAASFQAAGSYKTTQVAVSDPTTGSSTSTYEFIASVAQDTNGVITATKEAVRSASASQSGLMSAADYSKLAAIGASVSGDTLTITTQATA